jgi:hypothetical protein
LSSYVFLPCGAYFWLRGWLPRRDGALLGAFLITFSGFTLGHYGHINAVAIVAHLPWLLLAIDRLIVEERPRVRAAAGLGLGLVVASQALLGYPQYLLMNLLVEGLYVLCRAPGWRTLLCVTALNVLGLLTGCVQLLPTWEALHLSDRAGGGLWFAGLLSLHPLNFLQWLFPHGLEIDNLCEASLTNGLFVTAGLLSLWPWRHWGKAGPLARFALLLVGLGVFFALGRFNPLFKHYARLPVISLFRGSSRFTLFLHFAAALGAALLWCRLGQSSATPSSWKRLVWLALLPAAVVVALPALEPLLAARRAAPIWSEGVPLLCQVDQAAIPSCALWMGVVAALLALALRGWRLALPSLLVFIIAEQYWLNRWVLADMPRASLPELASRNSVPDSVARYDYPLGDGSLNAFCLQRIGLTTGYSGLPPRRRLDYDDPLTARVAAASWQWRDGGWQPFAGLPRARLVSRAWASAAPREDTKHIDVATTALVSEPIALEDGPGGAATIMVDRPGRVTITVDAPARRLLVLADSFHPGWRVTVDGAPGDCLAVYGDFLGCVVAGGKHEVHFDFDPASVRYGGWLSIAGLSLLVGWFGWSGSSAPKTRRVSLMMGRIGNPAGPVCRFGPQE